MRLVSQRQEVSSMWSASNSPPPLVTNSFIMSVRLWRQSSALLAARSTPTSWNPSGSRLASTRSYSAGTTRRLVRSPAAPKMTIAHGGATGARLSSASAPWASFRGCCWSGIAASLLSCHPTAVPRRRSGPARRRRTSPAPQHLLRRGDDSFRLEPEFLLQLLERSGAAEGLHTDDLAGGPDIAVPTQGRSLLDCDTSGNPGRQDAVAIRLRLMLEDVPGRHGDHARANSLGQQRLVRIDDERNLAARGNQDDLGRAIRRVRHDIGAAGNAGGGR